MTCCRLMLAQIGKAVTFNVNLNGAKGELKAHIDAPSGDDLEICYQEIDNHLWAIRFIPKENGVHYVAVKVRCVDATLSHLSVLSSMMFLC